MSHAAIVCREYGLPAVTGTGSASTTIRTGQMLRVDGNKGTVEILGRDAAVWTRGLTPTPATTRYPRRPRPMS